VARCDWGEAPRHDGPQYRPAINLDAVMSRFVSITTVRDFLSATRERIVIYDGAMGTQIQARNLGLEDYWDNEGCSEILVLSHPSSTIARGFISIASSMTATRPALRRAAR